MKQKFRRRFSRNRQYASGSSAVRRYPGLAAQVAVAVAAVAYEQNHATKPRPLDLRAEAARVNYEPRYA